ncbi:adenosylcobinamide-phosphate synthase CbiB [Lachnoanaerobaculum umeaense]|uniref:Cobalamin biosynthesis protein CobD n=1 Tax=Lachnoanaerobaculum umeaense TaxID=617123 RepID=A0A385Q471_9FIRM|nr:adenosylcobinamide-phosphate synthase CbiB [Lachnoanaerobaculum umeaense]AYA99573.1 cobalamin biosynthesis protein CobD [Lachnoanaerobaculum umeaense]PZW96492.1 adenosylcobinamide-phosphate synthase [Lachnoanaerobaculum umeaense]
MIHYFAFVCGFILDFFFRDIHKLPHLVRFIGSSISGLEFFLRKAFKSRLGQLFSGFLIVIFNILIWGFLAYFIDIFIYRINYILGFIIETFLFFQIFAKASLKYESMKVYNALKFGDIDSSRKALSMIVGRDTENLDFEQITKAVIETVAENMSDGIVAPWLYATLGSVISLFYNMEFLWLILVLPVIYKTINTMDSMIGYKSEKYIYIGKTAARLDDIVNFLPARFSAFTLLFVIFFISIVKSEFKIFTKSVKAFCKYRYIHSSPNAGQTESVIAGFFDTKLLGDAFYFGKLVKKRSIGDGQTKVNTEDIIVINNITYLAYVVLLIINLIIGGIACFIL